MRRDERGSILPMTALLMVVVLGFTAFAADLGLQRVAVRDMQAVADLVALDTARALPQCNEATLKSVAEASLAKQQSRLGRDHGLKVEAGHLHPETKEFVHAPTGTCDAVRITSSATVDFAFAPVIGTDSGDATRAAVATGSEPAVCFSAGTKAVVLNTSGGGLGPLLDRVIKANGLDVAGYTGLVNLSSLSVPLADLSTALSVGTAQELVDLSDLSLQRLTLATATVLRNQGRVAEANLLDSISARASSLKLDLGRVLAVDSSGDAALNADVNALDLLGTAIVAANGENAIRVNDLGLSLPGDVVALKANLVVLNPPQIACGGTGVKAKTAQVRVELRTGVNVLGLTSATVALGVEVAQGEAELTEIVCTAPQRTTVRGTTGVARVVGLNGAAAGGISVKLLLLELAGIGLSGEVGPHTTTHQFPYPPAPELKQHYGGTSRIILKADTSGILGLLKPLLNPLLDTVNALTGTLDLLLRPVLALLGIQVGSMDVMMLSTPSCKNVRLAG